VSAVRCRTTAILCLVALCLLATLVSAPAQAKEHPYNKGCRLLANDRYAAAARQFTKALKLNPEDTDALNNLAVCDIMLGKHDQARRLLRKALQINPRYAGAHLNIGGSAIVQEQPELALPPTVKASEARGGAASVTWVRAAAEYNLGLIALLNGDPKAARAAFARSAEIQRTPEAVLGAGVAACAEKDYEAAIASFKRAAQGQGRLARIARADLAAAYYKRGMEDFAAGSMDAARVYLEKAQAAHSTEAARIGLALVDAESGDYRGALGALDRLKTGSHSPEIRRLATLDVIRVRARADQGSAWVKWLAAALGLAAVGLLIAGFARARKAPSWRRPGAFLQTVTILLIPVTLAVAAVIFLDPLRTLQQLVVIVVLDTVVLVFLWRKRTA
jgi:tetratricopeptide (TPR) repeat protein